MILRWTCALPYLMRSHLLHYKTGSDSLQELLTADEGVCLHAWLLLHGMCARHCSSLVTLLRGVLHIVPASKLTGTCR